MKTNIKFSFVYLFFFLVVMSVPSQSQDYFSSSSNEISIKDSLIKAHFLKRLAITSNYPSVRSRALELTPDRYNSIADVSVDVKLEDKSNNIKSIDFWSGAFQNKYNNKPESVTESDLTETVLSSRLLFLFNYLAMNTVSIKEISDIVKNSLEAKQSILKEYVRYDLTQRDNYKITLIDNKQVIDRILYLYEKNKLLRIFGIEATSDYIIKSMRKDVVIVVKKHPVENDNVTLAFYDRSELFNGDLPEEIRAPLFDETLHKSVFMEYLRADLTDLILSDDNIGTEINNKETKTNLKLSLFDPSLSFNYAMIPGEVNLFGKWGYDNIPIPGWYMDEFIGGIKTHFSNDKNQKILELRGGALFRINRPFKKLNPVYPMYNTGSGYYFAAMGTIAPLFSWDKSIYNFVENKILINVEGRFNSSPDKTREKNTFEEINEFDFYSLRKYMSCELIVTNIIDRIELLKGFNLGSLSFSIGTSLVEIKKYRLDPNDISSKYVKDLNEFYSKFTLEDSKPFFKVNLVKESSVTSHKFEFSYIRDIQYKYHYLGTTFEILFGDKIGFEAKMFMGYPEKNLPPFSFGNYFVVGPVIKF